METLPLVSIITPFFNAEAYFEEAIASVMAQTYSRWELLLVDDGSSDRSSAIAQQKAAQYPSKIYYLEHAGHQNLGKSSARNLGIQQAQGDYIALLDADDVYEPLKLEKQVALLQAHPQAGMVYGPTLYWYGWTGKASDSRRDRLAYLGVPANTLIQPPHLMTLYLKTSGVVPCTCGLMARRQIVEAVGGFDEAIQHLYEDQVFIAKLCLQAPVFVEAGCWDKYRQHPDSSSVVAARQGEYHPLRLNPARLAFLSWLGDYLKAQQQQDKALLQAYQQAVWHYQHPQFAWLLLPLENVISRLKSRLAQLLGKATPPYPS
ncbi:MAG: glycosyl transferase family 2 [Leptolyngbya foveolarum]|uniref:Glycosyl transferase family 2 n=1 Tax=Leptolyngbya foveolarum TaxID=47253 RepID=A0A2W4U0N7_9CYAN|nr:MAG: glycosyl transferase family 2 [Leptolyngbya foveolarum]